MDSHVETKNRIQIDPNLIDFKKIFRFFIEVLTRSKRLMIRLLNLDLNSSRNGVLESLKIFKNYWILSDVIFHEDFASPIELTWINSDRRFVWIKR